MPEKLHCCICLKCKYHETGTLCGIHKEYAEDRDICGNESRIGDALMPEPACPTCGRELLPPYHLLGRWLRVQPPSGQRWCKTCKRWWRIGEKAEDAQHMRRETLEEWRKSYNENSPFRQQVDGIIADALRRENEKGHDKYGPDFVGDPMTQAVEELIGALRYMATELGIARNAEAHYRLQIEALQDRLKVREP